MRNFKPLLTSGLVIGVCLFSAVPVMAGPHNHTGVVYGGPKTASATKINALFKTDKGLANQLLSLRQSNEAQRKADLTQKNYSALLAANSDESKMVQDYTEALTARLNLEKDNIKLQMDGQAANALNSVAGDQDTVVTDLNNQIAARKQLITDAQTILKDLGGSVTASTDTTTTSSNTTDDTILIDSAQ
ncbi:hypothetical protein [Desulfosporosinus sp. SB140]|uniref:hypothetical protein n=1 Tax=Desulfosporosinus paludis TaxID=3115649 RepID=UPI0038902E58